MAKANAQPVVRMPRQHIREGRGEAGYKSTDEGRVEVYDTAAPASLSSSSGSGRKSKADWQAEAAAAGIEYDDSTTVAELKAALAGEA